MAITRFPNGIAFGGVLVVRLKTVGILA